jgi:hypothetical protein
MMGEAKRKAARFVAEIDHAELAARFAEIAMGLKRPTGITGKEFMDDALRRAAASGEPDATYAVKCWGTMAHTAILYLGECIENGKQPS